MNDFRSNRHQIINSLRQQFIWLIVYSIGLTIFALVCNQLRERELFSFDKALLLWIHQFANPLFDRLFLFITALGDSEMVVIILLSTIFWLGMEGRYLDGVRVFILCSGGFLINSVMKLFFTRPHPELWQKLIAEYSFSFPREHAVSSMIIYGFIAYLMKKELPEHKETIQAIAITIVVAIGFSRLYLGVHYPTDIIAGYGIGFLWLITCLQLNFESDGDEVDS
jgi:membrane-associated phospholipid phosphatase